LYAFQVFVDSTTNSGARSAPGLTTRNASARSSPAVTVTR
jgi:hypothetical protein